MNNMKPQDQKIKCPLCQYENRPYLNDAHRYWYKCMHCGINTPLFRIKKMFNENNKK